MTIEDMLRETLEDHRLSRGEKSALKTRFSDHSGDNAVIRAVAFDLARAEIAEHRGDDRQIVDWLEGVVKALDSSSNEGQDGFSSRAYFSPGDDCLNSIVTILKAIRTSADICVFTITDDRIGKAMIEAQRRGVRVRVISDDDKSEDLGSDIDTFARAGLEVATDRTDAHMHHKFAIFDRSILLTGSYNWTRSAATENQENIALTEDPKLLRSYQQEFDRLWEKLA